MADQKLQITQLARRLGGLKTGLSSRIRAANNAISVANSRNPPTEAAVEELKNWQSKIRESAERIEAVYTHLMEMDQEDKVDVHLAGLDEENQRANSILHAINTALQRVPSGSTTSESNRPQEQNTVRANEALKPFVLSLDHTPAEMRGWIRRFTAYYTSSNMDKGSKLEQQAYFMSVLESSLEAKVREKLSNSTPIFRNGDLAIEVTCIELLEKAFINKYSMLTRRFHFFNHKQAPGQNFSDWALKLRSLGSEADLGSITTDELYMLIYICGTSDAKLREKFLEVSEPSLEKFDLIVSQHEAAQSTVRAITEESQSTKVCQVREARMEQRGSKQINTERPSMAELKRLNRCIRCGYSLVNHAFCPGKDKTCRICQVKGHLARVCQRNDNKVKGQSIAKARQVDSHTQDEDDSSSDSEVKRELVQKIRVRRAQDYNNEQMDYMRVMITTNDATFQFEAIPDTGTVRTLISENVARDNGLRVHKTRTKLFAANDTPMICNGKCNINIEYSGKRVATTALVTSALHNEVLIGKQDLKGLNVITHSFPKALMVKENEDVGLAIDNMTSALKQQFPEVFTNVLSEKPMSGQPMHIYLKENSVPTKTLTARQYPIHIAKAAKKAVDELKKTVLEEVHEPTDWISPGFFVLKGEPTEKQNMKKGHAVVTVKDLRLVVDFTGLNKYVKRPVHNFPSSKDIMDRISPGSKFFCKMDCIQGYHQIELDEESSKLTTFILPEGRFRFKRTPMGLSASSDEWCKRSDEVIRGLEGTQKIVDDILVTGVSLEQLQDRVEQVLQRCQKYSVSISHKKFVIGERVKFAGHVVSSSGIEPDPDTVAAIANFPCPKDKTELRRFLGLANQLGAFNPDIAHMSSNLRPLTSSKAAFLWLDDHQRDFEKMRSLLSSSKSCVSFFDPCLKTEVLTDASRLQGLGFALVQRDENSGLKLISCGSRSLTPAESRYATVELECLAVQWAVHRCRQFLLGMHHFDVITDHKPLMGVFRKRIDETTNPRLLSLREKLSCFWFEVKWIEGKVHLIADALSRAPVFQPPDTADTDASESVICCKIDSYAHMQDIINAANQDDDYKLIRECVSSNTNVKTLHHDHPAKLLQSVWSQASVSKSGIIIIDGHKMFVPFRARRAVLKTLHIPHCGIEKTRKTASTFYWWPGLSSDIKSMVEACELCQRTRPSKPLDIPVRRSAHTPMD